MSEDLASGETKPRSHLYTSTLDDPRFKNVSMGDAPAAAPSIRELAVEPAWTDLDVIQCGYRVLKEAA